MDTMDTTNFILIDDLTKIVFDYIDYKPIFKKSLDLIKNIKNVTGYYFPNRVVIGIIDYKYKHNQFNFHDNYYCPNCGNFEDIWYYPRTTNQICDCQTDADGNFIQRQNDIDDYDYDESSSDDDVPLGR